MYTLRELYEQYQPILAPATHQEHRYWVLPIDYPNPFLSRTQDFSCGDTSISIIDHYHGRRPWLLTQDFLSGGEVHLQFIPTIILDSHIVSYLRDFVNANEKMPRARHRAVLQLLEYLVINKFDYNPFYYWLEASKTPNSKAHVSHATEAIFKLHNMDKERFLRTGQVYVDPLRQAEYLEESNEPTLADVAAAATANVPGSELQRYLSDQAAFSYTALLCIVMIEARYPKKKLAERMRLFHTFMTDKLRLSTAREIIVAILYFAGGSGKFIPRLQRNSKPDEVLWKCQAAAWDLVLLRLPELLLVNPEFGPIPLAYVCTGERALQKIGRSWIMMYVESAPPNPRIPRTAIMPNIVELRTIISDTEIAQLDNLQAESNERLQASRKNGASNHISKADLPSLTSVFEEQIRNWTLR